MSGSDEIAVIEQLLRPASCPAADLPASLTPLALALEEFSDGQDYPVISAVRLPDEPRFVRSRFVVIRQMTDVPDRYVVQTVHADTEAATGWCAERSRYRVGYESALVILAGRISEAL